MSSSIVAIYDALLSNSEDEEDAGADPVVVKFVANVDTRILEEEEFQGTEILSTLDSEVFIKSSSSSIAVVGLLLILMSSFMGVKQHQR